MSHGKANGARPQPRLHIRRGRAPRALWAGQASADGRAERLSRPPQFATHLASSRPAPSSGYFSAAASPSVMSGFAGFRLAFIPFSHRRGFPNFYENESGSALFPAALGIRYPECPEGKPREWVKFSGKSKAGRSEPL